MAACSYGIECAPFLPDQASNTVKPHSFFQNLLTGVLQKWLATTIGGFSASRSGT